MPELAYLNGSFCPISEAQVSIEDRGFQFADGVYEVVVFHGDRPVMLDAHLERLARSCRGIRLDVDLERLNITGLIEQGVRRAAFQDTMVYVQLTRGVAPRNHIYPRHGEPTVILTFKPTPVVDPDKRRQGVAVMTVTDNRWSRCDIKSIALLPNVMAKNEALANGFDDAVFIGPEGDVREASAANLFIIQDGCLLTHPTDATILPGITRKLVLSCAACIDLPVREVSILHADLLSADEAFLCSTVIDILPLVRVDDRVIGPGTPGRHTLALYEQMVQQAVEESRS